MSQPMLIAYRSMGEVAEQTRRLLARRRRGRALDPAQRAELDRTLEHLAAVREGFQLSLRSGSAAQGELRDIVYHTMTMIDWSFLAGLGMRLQLDNQVHPLGSQLLAYTHATIALALTPMLPPSEISHPASNHYRDLARPTRPGEWLERIEELERVLLQIRGDRESRPQREALRRTHAYFDATAWLIRDHLDRFGRAR